MNVAILVAAGRGARMGRDKLFLHVAGKPVIAHTWGRFDESRAIHEIVIVVRPGMEKKFFNIGKNSRLLSVARNGRILFGTDCKQRRRKRKL
jgi:2-C-methyl-D-erythritol 4-phosphate cytidylyltransferase